MAASVFLLVFVCSADLVWRVSSDDAVKLDCPAVSYGTYSRDSQIQCSMKSSPGLNVFWMMWKRVPSEAPLPAPSLFSVRGGSGKRFESGWDRSSMEVWLLVKSVRVADEGRYACLVLTNRGYVERSVSLKVIARHSEPSVWSVPERNIEEDAAVTMFCRALGGFPRGAVRWFDQYATNWTRSARTDARERDDGRFDLTSAFHVRRVSSASPGYRCCVVSGDGDKEGEAEIHLAFREPEKRVQRWSNNSIVAVIVVAGSLTTGLLLLALLQRRRPRREHRALTRSVRARGFSSSCSSRGSRGESAVATSRAVRSYLPNKRMDTEVKPI